jgi:NAD(P)H-hydrate epimerase
MIKYVSVTEMVAIEKEADASGLTYAIMMENAGRGLAEAVHSAYSPIKERGVLGLVGSGNNGGDTLVALTLLAELGWQTSAYIVRLRSKDDHLVERFRSAGGDIYLAEGDSGFQKMAELLGSHAVILDGVLGTGIRLPLKKEIAEALDVARRRLAALPGAHVVAVDCPSGVDCDSGDVAPECIPAELTVSMAAAKRGLLKFPAYNFLGELRFVGIGLGDGQPYPKAWETIKRFAVDREWVRSVIPARPLDAHKGTFGTLLVVAGSLNYTGAAWLAGQAAYRSGAGLVTLAVPQPLHLALAGQFPEATWLLLPDEDGVIAEHAAEVVRSNLERVTALLVGPGFGLQETTRKFIARLLVGGPKPARGSVGFAPVMAKTTKSEVAGMPPLVFDADGLKLLARLPDWPGQLPSPAVLTPHPGEMSVLTGLSVQEIQANRVEIAEKFAQTWGHVLVLKGAFTVVASPDGQTGMIPVASPALARAGTGDVLAGLIAGLRAQGVEAFPAAAAGAWIHAQAGLKAARALGSTASVMAGDVLREAIKVMEEVCE